jgi:hypothetical protein
MRDSSGAEFFRGTSGLQVIPFFYTFQLAGVPDRAEPNIGEVNFPYLFHLVVSSYTQSTYCQRQGSNLQPYDPKSQNVLPVSADWSASVQDVRPLPDRRGLNR